MLEGLRTAAAGMAAQQQKLDGIANDLANANTTGYKHTRIGFKDLLYEQGGRPSPDTVVRDASSFSVGKGAAVADAPATTPRTTVASMRRFIAGSFRSAKSR